MNQNSPTPLHAQRQASARERLAIAFSVAFLLVQALLPLLGLVSQRPAMFAWQMYSGVKHLTSYEAITADGVIGELDPTDYVGLRADVHFESLLPAHLCRVVDDATAIRVTASGPGHVVDHPCP